MYNISQLFSNPIVITVLEVLDDDKLDREWVVRNLMGGIAAGFGLRGMPVRLHADRLTNLLVKWCSTAHPSSRQ